MKKEVIYPHLNQNGQLDIGRWIHRRFLTYCYTLSPDWKKIAVAYREINDTSIYILESIGGPLKYLCCIPNLKTSPIWLNDNEHLLIADDYVYLVRLTSPWEPIRLPLTKGFLPACISSDNRFIYGIILDEDNTFLIRYSLNDSSFKILFKHKGLIGDHRGLISFPCITLDKSISCSTVGSIIAFVTITLEERIASIILMDGFTGDILKNIELKDIHYDIPDVRFTPNGKNILFRANTTGHAKIWMAGVFDSSLKQITYGDYDDESFAIDPTGSKIAFSSLIPGTCSLSLSILNLSSGNVKILISEKGVNRPISWSNNLVYYTHASSNQAPDCWSIDIDSKEKKRITFSAPLGMGKKIHLADEITVCSDGVDISSKLYTPFQDKNNEGSLIIWLHGGPFIKGFHEYSPFEAWLTTQGFNVCSINYRGTTGFGLDFCNDLLGEGFGIYDVNDVLSVVHHLISFPEFKDRKVGIGGTSYGGYLTLRAICEDSVFKCAFAHAAITNWHLQQLKTAIRFYDHWLLNGYVNDNIEMCRERSPINQIQLIKTPTMITHGKLDKDVPFCQADQFVECAKTLKAPVQHMFYKNMLHGLPSCDYEEYVHWHTMLVDYFNRYLKSWNNISIPTRGQRIWNKII